MTHTRLDAGRHGFTAMEVLVSMVLLGLVLGGSLMAWMYASQAERRNSTQCELDINVRITIERLRDELRRSDMGKILLYSPTGVSSNYTAISFPLARDDDGDGLTDTDANGWIIWRETVIYHVWTGEPYKLLRTRLEGWNPDPAQRLAQMQSVVALGADASDETRTMFANLFTWSLDVATAGSNTVYDSYAASGSRHINAAFGSALLLPGTNRFTFRVTGKNAASGGYQVALDTLMVSPAGLSREAEQQLPAVDVSGSTPVSTFINDETWSEKRHLVFSAGGVGDRFTLNIENDAWEESNFNTTGKQHQRTVREYDPALQDYVVRLDGGTTTWTAVAQTLQPQGSYPTDTFSNTAVRVILRGGTMFFDGQKPVVDLQGLTVGDIQAASIAVASPTVPGQILSSTVSSLSLAASTSGVRATTSSAYPISRTNDYAVTFVLNSAPPAALPAWSSLTDTVCFIRPNCGYGGAEASWPWLNTNNYSGVNTLLAVAQMSAGYPTNGLFISQIVDTGLAAPTYRTITWNTEQPSGTSVYLKARAGNTPDMSDAPSWDSASVVDASTPGSSLASLSGRYIQFAATLTPSSMGVATPLLRDVRINWVGPERFLDVGGTVSKGPSGGMFELRVNDQPLVRGVRVALTIFKDVPITSGRTERLVSSMAMEVEPRNTGK